MADELHGPCAECGEPLAVGEGPDHVFCDLCGGAEHPADMPPDWDGETGCHLQCEADAEFERAIRAAGFTLTMGGQSCT